MSAFRISFASLDAMLTFAACAVAPRSALSLTIPGDAPCSDGEPIRIDFSDPAHCTDAGRILIDANAESLAALFGANDSRALEAVAMAELYEFVPFAELPTPQAVIGAAACYAYQSDRHDGWTMSVAQWVALQIQSHAAKALASGYWDIGENPTRGAEPSPELAPVDESTDAPAATRGALIARMAAAMDESTMAPVDPAPEPELAAARGIQSVVDSNANAALQQFGAPDSTSSHRIALSDIIAANERQAQRAAQRKERAAELKRAKAAPKHDRTPDAVVPPAKGKRSKAAAPTAA